MVRKKRKSVARMIVRGVGMFLKTTMGLMWEILKLPYYLYRGARWLAPRVNQRVEKTHARVARARTTSSAYYQPFRVIKELKGSFEKWECTTIESDSTIGIVLGARGSGKTAFGVALLENVHARTAKKMYAIGFRTESMPAWISVVNDVNKVENDSFVLIDEGGVLFNSRASMSNANKMLSELIFISRHKNLSILFISQNSANLEVNVLRQADYLVLKKSSLLQHEFERKIIQKLYEKSAAGFEVYKDEKGISYIHSSEFQGFVANELPSFWKTEISKSFR